jgi:hypothetical protein
MNGASGLAHLNAQDKLRSLFNAITARNHSGMIKLASGNAQVTNQLLQSKDGASGISHQVTLVK